MREPLLPTVVKGLSRFSRRLDSVPAEQRNSSCYAGSLGCSLERSVLWSALLLTVSLLAVLGDHTSRDQWVQLWSNGLVLWF